MGGCTDCNKKEEDYSLPTEFNESRFSPLNMRNIGPFTKNMNEESEESSHCNRLTINKKQGTNKSLMPELLMKRMKECKHPAHIRIPMINSGMSWNMLQNMEDERDLDELGTEKPDFNHKIYRAYREPSMGDFEPLDDLSENHLLRAYESDKINFTRLVSLSSTPNQPHTPNTPGIHYPMKLIEMERADFVKMSHRMYTKVRKITEKNTLDKPLPPNISTNRLKLDISKFRCCKKGSVMKNYKILNRLGKGSYGEVRKIQHTKTGQIRVLKIISKNKFSKEIDPVTEFEILKNLDHPNIVRIFEYYQDSINYHLVMEYCGGGELFTHLLKLEHFTERQAAYTIFQILSTIAYCHERNIVHRDIKPENLLLANDSLDSTIKVIDFGASKMYKDQEVLSRPFGTAYYIAPEVIMGEYNQKCDIWSTGVIAYLLLCGKAPFPGRNTDEILSNVLKGTFSLQGGEWRNVSSEAKNFINKLLIYNPRERVSAIQALSDAWIMNLTTNVGEILKETALLTFNNLSKFGCERKLQSAVINLMVAQMQDKEEETRLRNVFQAFDSNKDGQLSREDLIEGYCQLFGNLEIAELEVDRIIQQVDVNQNGLIDYSEFLVANANLKNLLSQKKLKVVFSELDLDGNGKIAVWELKEYFKNLEADEFYWEEALDEVDMNRNGEINFEEFNQMMGQLIRSSGSFTSIGSCFNIECLIKNSRTQNDMLPIESLNLFGSPIANILKAQSLWEIPREGEKSEIDRRVQSNSPVKRKGRDKIVRIRTLSIPEHKSASPATSQNPIQDISNQS